MKYASCVRRGFHVWYCPEEETGKFASSNEVHHGSIMRQEFVNRTSSVVLSFLEALDTLVSNGQHCNLSVEVWIVNHASTPKTGPMHSTAGTIVIDLQYMYVPSDTVQVGEVDQALQSIRYCKSFIKCLLPNFLRRYSTTLYLTNLLYFNFLVPCIS